ncbi:transposase orfB for insertion sequence element IS3 family [Paenibacillus algicola]|uniref:Transposase orfB for insertion sequence element IS3 family n=1 Tax=Paenibacillus algicola TaxID=2565926 RepID=A0A4P8XFE5_9BACL|nr:transposase orfB for insertion sequence element IS3 family [Paenibacillus algicola]
MSSIEEAQRRMEEYIHIHNKGRAKRKLNKLTPVEYRRQLAA